MARFHRGGLAITGFTLQETLVATVIGVLVIGGAGFALQSSLRSIQRSTTTALARDSNATALALLRAEVIGSTQLLFRQGSSSVSDNLDGSDYQGAITSCQAQSIQAGSAPFNPVFGLLRSDSNEPVIYGLALGRNGTSYSLQRCASPGGSSTGAVLSPVLEGIAPVPCADGRRACPPPSLDGNGNNPALATTLQTLSNTLGPDNTTPVRTPGQPAFRIRTDAQHDRLELIDATTAGDGIESSFTSADPTGVTGRAPLYLTARVSSVLATPAGPGSNTVGTFFGLPVRRPDNGVGAGYVFVVDRTQAMSTCSRWGTTKQTVSWYYFNPDPAWYQSAFWQTDVRCLQTRMAFLQSQLIGLYGQLPDDSWAAICIVSLSDNSCTSYALPSQRSLMRTKINSLDDGDPRTWGADANPWKGVSFAFSKPDTMVIYHATASDPSQAYDGSAWSLISSGYPPTVWSGSSADRTLNYYIGRNGSRANKITYNTVVMSDHPNSTVWPQMFSAKLGGTFVNYADDPKGPP